jgi:CubicO group peptidase (beta-lactamase class C family)
MKIKIILIIVPFIFLGECLNAQIHHNELDKIIQRQMQRHKIPQLSVSVIWRDSLVYNKEFGNNSSTQNLYYIGSTSKTFTALAIAQLKDSEKLNFDDRAGKYLSEFPYPDISIRQLLTHTSGFSQYAGHNLKAQRTGIINHISLKNEPGEKYEYSSLNFIILGMIVEKVSGMTYGEYIKKHIFDPLEMIDSNVAGEGFGHKDLAKGNQYMLGFIRKAPSENIPYYLIPAGFIVSNSTDMANYLSIFLNEGKFKEREIISVNTLREMLTPYFGDKTGISMGWGVGETSIGHSGNTRGFSNRSSIFPNDEYAICVMSNINNGPFFDGNSETLQAISSQFRNKSFVRNWISEWHLSLLLLLLVIVDFSFFVRNITKWKRDGFPTMLVRSNRVVLMVLKGIVISIFLLVILPYIIGVPLRVLWEYFPQFGVAITVAAIINLCNGLLKASMSSLKIKNNYI